jgi:hypothetical protein
MRAGFAHLVLIIFDFHQQWLAIMLLSSVGLGFLTQSLEKVFHLLLLQVFTLTHVRVALNRVACTEKLPTPTMHKDNLIEAESGLQVLQNIIGSITGIVFHRSALILRCWQRCGLCSALALTFSAYSVYTRVYVQQATYLPPDAVSMLVLSRHE